MSLRNLLLGRPLASNEEGEQRVGPVAGIPMLGLDALSSAAYGPEAAMTLLIPLGAAGLRYIGPISTIIIILLLIVFLSYRQTIAAYPAGGGSYTVARHNLGLFAGLLAAAALLLDYALVVAVGISAGVGALVSAVPSLQPHTLMLCLGILALIALVNLRGVRESGVAFVLPTYLFVFCLFGVIAIGLIKTWLAHGHPAPEIAPPVALAATTTAGWWIVVRAFASGCTAMTGVEAVSTGVTAFREPAVDNAKRTLSAIIGILVVLLAGIFGGVTDRLIPLFAVGAFLAFTLSEAGMVAHWRTSDEAGRTPAMLVNGLGSLATGVTLVVVLVAKFAEGAWVMTLLIPALLAVFLMVARHYRAVAIEIANPLPLNVTNIQPPIVIIPMGQWNRMSQKGLRFALKLSRDIFVVQVQAGAQTESDLSSRWREYVEAPAVAAGLPMPKLVIVASPYRHVFNPLIDYVLEVKREHPDRQIAVLIPELVARRWYHHFLHNKRAAMLKALLLVRGDEDIVVINVPWYLAE